MYHFIVFSVFKNIGLPGFGDKIRRKIILLFCWFELIQFSLLQGQVLLQGHTLDLHAVHTVALLGLTRSVTSLVSGVQCTTGIFEPNQPYVTAVT